MWLNSLFFKTKINEDENTIQQSVNENTINEEKNEILLKNDKEPIIKTDLEKRDEDVKIIHENTQALKNKQDLNLNCHSTTDIKNHEEINNCKIAEVLRIIPIIEKNLQTLTDKVSCLSGLLDIKQLNTKVEPDHNTISNNTNINIAPNSVNKLNGMENTSTPKKKKTTLGKISKKNKEMPSNKQKVINKNIKTNKKNKPETTPTEIIKQNERVIINTENLPESVKSDNQLTNLDGRLECFFTKIQSALAQFKIDQVNEKSDIMVHLSGLENKMNKNEMNIDKLMCNVEQLSKNDEHLVMKSNSNNTEKENKQELQKSINDIKMCIDYLIQPDIPQAQQCMTTDTPNTNTNININSACNSNRCVCKLIDNTNADNLQIINSHDGNNQIKYGDIILCEFLKAKLTLEMIKRSEHQQILQVNQISNQIVDKKNSNLSVCFKNTNHLKNDCVQKQNVEQNICQLPLCSKPSVHHFFKNGVENVTKSNQMISSCEKNQICDFLSSQPIPEWIRRSQNLVVSDNPCGKDAKFPQTNCDSNASKFYNVERIVKESCGNDNTDDTVYEITQKQIFPEKNNKDCTVQHNSEPCKSLDKNPWTV